MSEDKVELKENQVPQLEGAIHTDMVVKSGTSCPDQNLSGPVIAPVEPAINHVISHV